MIQPVKAIQIHVFGDRLYPLGQFKLAENQIGPFEKILAVAQQKNPAATEEDLVRAIWVQGLHAVVKRLEGGERLESTTGRFNVNPAQVAPSKTPPPPIPTGKPTPPDEPVGQNKTGDEEPETADTES